MPESDIDFVVENDHELESAANPLRAHRHVSNKSLVVKNKNLLELAPGQDKKTKHILLDGKAEERAFSKIFFKGIFGYTFWREYYLTSTKYFNRLLLSCS